MTLKMGKFSRADIPERSRQAAGRGETAGAGKPPQAGKAGEGKGRLFAFVGETK